MAEFGWEPMSAASRCLHCAQPIQAVQGTHRWVHASVNGQTPRLYCALAGARTVATQRENEADAAASETQPYDGKPGPGS